MLLDLTKQLKEINQFDADRPLGVRMKQYENLTRFDLDKNLPLIIRIDGNAFHTFTRGFRKPFDKLLKQAMEQTSAYLVERIPGAQMAYHQSDEISILVTPNKLSNNEYTTWFSNNLNKIVSITASMATLKFNKVFNEFVEAINEDFPVDLEIKQEELDIRAKYEESRNNGALFDSRVFTIPKDEVDNYFIWRQQDAIKNSISMVAQSMFSHKSLQGVNGKQMIERMRVEKGIIYEETYSVSERRGSVIHRLEPKEFVKEIKQYNGQVKLIKYTRAEWGTDLNIPVFREDRGYIEKFL